MLIVPLITPRALTFTGGDKYCCETTSWESPFPRGAKCRTYVTHRAAHAFHHRQCRLLNLFTTSVRYIDTYTGCFVTCGIVRLKIMKTNRINVCPICLRLWDIMDFINRANSSKLVSPGMVHSIFMIIIIEVKKTHVLLCIQDIDTSLVWTYGQG